MARGWRCGIYRCYRCGGCCKFLRSGRLNDRSLPLGIGRGHAIGTERIHAAWKPPRLLIFAYVDAHYFYQHNCQHTITFTALTMAGDTTNGNSSKSILSTMLAPLIHLPVSTSREFDPEAFTANFPGASAASNRARGREDRPTSADA